MSEKFIPLSVPNIKGNEVKYVTQALEDEWVSTGGTRIEEFEQKLLNRKGRLHVNRGLQDCILRCDIMGFHLKI